MTGLKLLTTRLATTVSLVVSSQSPVMSQGEGHSLMMALASLVVSNPSSVTSRGQCHSLMMVLDENRKCHSKGILRKNSPNQYENKANHMEKVVLFNFEQNNFFQNQMIYNYYSSHWRIAEKVEIFNKSKKTNQQSVRRVHYKK